MVGALIGAFFLFTGLVMLGGVPIRNRCVLRGIVVGPLGIVMSGVDCLGNGLLKKENMARRALYSCCFMVFVDETAIKSEGLYLVDTRRSKTLSLGP